MTPTEAAAVADWVATVAPGYRWGGRQGIDRIAPGLEARVLHATFADAVDDADARVHAVVTGAEVHAATVRTPKPLETDAFGMDTASLSHVVCPEATEDRHAVVAALLAEAVGTAADDGVYLLVLRVDSDDVGTLAAAQRAGFVVCEATTTWLADSALATGPAPVPDGLSIEVHEVDVRGALDPDEVDALAATTAAWPLNHFAADPLLPASAVARFYGRWVHNIASGAWSDCLFVARHEGRLVGIESEVSDRGLRSATGVDVRAGEWIVVGEHGLGAGRALMAAAGHHAPPGVRFHSWETQARNTATVRCIQQTGLARPIRAGYTLHAWPRRG